MNYDNFPNNNITNNNNSNHCNTETNLNKNSENISINNNLNDSPTKLKNFKNKIKAELEKYNDDNLNDSQDNLVNFDFLNYNTTGKQLNKLRETLVNQSLNLSKLNLNKNSAENNSQLAKSIKNKILSKKNQENLQDSSKEKSLSKIKYKNLKISYRGYTDFVNRYQVSKKSELNFTIPKPFPFMKKDYLQKKLKKIEEILEQRKKKEDKILGYRFKANDLKREIFISQFENIIKEEKIKRKNRTEKIKEKIIQEMKPFSFYEADEKRYIEKTTKMLQAPQFTPFKANPIPWKSQVNLYKEIIKKSSEKRKVRCEKRAKETFNNSKLPPRMEMYEKKKKEDEELQKLKEKSMKKVRRCQSFKVKYFFCDFLFYCCEKNILNIFFL